MAKYKISGDGVVDTERGAKIPNNPNNGDWQDYLAWVADGNTPDPEFTQAEIDNKVLRDEINELKGDLLKVIAWQFRMILEMYQVGIAKGLWVAGDFSQEVRDKAIIFKQKSDRLIELGE